MSIATALMASALDALRCTEGQMADRLNYSRKTVSAVKCGDRRLQLDMLQSIVREADDPDVYARAISLITGGVGPLVLDGPYTDDTPAAVLDWVISELTETIEAAKECKVLRTRKPSSEWTPEEWAQVDRFAHQDREGFEATWAGLRMACRQRGTSIRAEFEALEAECVAKGYQANGKSRHRCSGADSAGRD